MFPLNNLARKGLKMKPHLEATGSQNTRCHVRQREKQWSLASDDKKVKKNLFIAEMIWKPHRKVQIWNCPTPFHNQLCFVVKQEWKYMISYKIWYIYIYIYVTQILLIIFSFFYSEIAILWYGLCAGIFHIRSLYYLLFFSDLTDLNLDFNLFTYSIKAITEFFLCKDGYDLWSAVCAWDSIFL